MEIGARTVALALGLALGLALALVLALALAIALALAHAVQSFDWEVGITCRNPYPQPSYAPTGASTSYP